MATLLSDSDIETLKRIINKVDALRGDGVLNDHYNIRIMQQRAAALIQDAQTAAAKPLPTGQYQYMSYMMVAQNQAGFDFIRGHSLI